ncbi:MAG: glycosyltransferase family 2 protein [Microscillaceae bacterium]|nr:glycosyltransferase family 2 protein [Microscillaceae bacterium]
MPKISAVLITLNEALNLPRVLASVQWCDEMVVVDSGSTDNTLALAQSLGAKTFYNKFEGYGPQKHFAVSQACHDWVLIVDADEEVSPGLAQEIQAMMKNETIAFQGFRLPRDFVFMGRVMRYGGLHGEMYLRLFNRKFGNFNDKKIHESAIIEGKIGRLKGRLMHYSYRHLEDYFQKYNHYTSLAARDLHQKGKKTAPWKIYLRFPFTFFNCISCGALSWMAFRALSGPLFRPPTR